MEGSTDRCYTTTHVQTWGSWNNLYRSRISGTHSSNRQCYSLTTCHKHISLVIVNKLKDKININRVFHNAIFWDSHDYLRTRSMIACLWDFYWVLLRSPIHIALWESCQHALFIINIPGSCTCVYCCCCCCAPVAAVNFWPPCVCTSLANCTGPPFGLPTIL